MMLLTGWFRKIETAKFGWGGLDAKVPHVKHFAIETFHCLPNDSVFNVFLPYIKKQGLLSNKI